MIPGQKSIGEKAARVVKVITQQAGWKEDGGRFFACQRSHKYDKVVEHIPEDMDLEEFNLMQVLTLVGSDRNSA